MRIEAAVESLRRRYVGQISQPAESGAPQVREPASSTPGHEVAKDEAPVSDVAGWKTCPTTDDGERRGVSPPVCTQASHRSNRAKTSPRPSPHASVSRRSTGGLTSRRSPGAPIGRIVFLKYAKTLAGICRQTSAGQLVATKSTSLTSAEITKPLRLANRRSCRPLTIRQRGPPHASARPQLRFPLSAFRFWMSFGRALRTSDLSQRAFPHPAPLSTVACRAGIIRIFRRTNRKPRGTACARW